VAAEPGQVFGGDVQPGDVGTHDGKPLGPRTDGAGDAIGGEMTVMAARSGRVCTAFTGRGGKVHGVPGTQARGMRGDTASIFGASLTPV
jgi:hypothetical protein